MYSGTLLIVTSSIATTLIRLIDQFLLIVMAKAPIFIMWSVLVLVVIVFGIEVALVIELVISAADHLWIVVDL